MTRVKVLRPFNSTPQGDFVDVGDEIDVTDVRAEELVLLRLAERLQAKKAAATPQNKMAPPPENKEAPSPEKPAGSASQAKQRRTRRVR